MGPVLMLSVSSIIRCGGSVVSTRMLLSSHYLHDYNDFYSDFGINSLHTFVWTFLDNDYRLGFTLTSELLPFLYIFFSHFLDISDIISHRSVIFVSQSETTISLTCWCRILCGFILVCVCVDSLIFCFVHRRCVSCHQPQSPQEYTLPSYYGKLILINHSQSREMFVKKLSRLRIWSPRYKYENIFKTQHPKPNSPEMSSLRKILLKPQR